jgi:hypothetical protein
VFTFVCFVGCGFVSVSIQNLIMSKRTHAQQQKHLTAKFVHAQTAIPQTMEVRQGVSGNESAIPSPKNTKSLKYNRLLRTSSREDVE